MREFAGYSELKMLAERGTLCHVADGGNEGPARLSVVGWRKTSAVSADIFYLFLSPARDFDAFSCIWKETRKWRKPLIKLINLCL